MRGAPVAAVVLALAGLGWLIANDDGILTEPSPLNPVTPTLEEARLAREQAVAQRADVDAPPDADDAPPDRPEADAEEGPAIGRFRPARTPTDEAAQLEAIGYVAGSREAGEDSGVTLHDPERAWQGLNLYTSGHAPEALLMDMDGRILHRWRADFDDVWPDWEGRPNENMRFWRRVHLLPDGSLLAIFEGIGLIKLDAESNVLWARPNAAHHDLDVLDDGTIWVLTRRVEFPAESFRKPRTLVDYASHLDAEGRNLERIDLISAYFASRFGPHWRPRAEKGGDAFHTNSLEVLREDAGGALKSGRLLLSMRHLDAIAVLAPETGTIVWSAKGTWRLQHDPKVVDGNRLLLFDNGPPAREASRVLEIEVGTSKEVWTYQGSEDAPFWSATCGTADRLPNGNTLITESDGGRAFEVTREGEVVWEFHSPHRPDDDPSLVATLFEVVRLPADLDLSWIPAEPTP